MGMRVVLGLLFLAGVAWGLYTYAPIKVSVELPNFSGDSSATTTESTDSSKQNVSTQATAKPPAPKPPATAPAPAPVTSSTQFCPKFETGIEKGAKDVLQVPDYARGDVASLQVFLARQYGLNEKTFVDGIFGDNTESYLKRYQREKGLSETGVVDLHTQRNILNLCLVGLKANGAEYPKRNFTLTTGSVTMKTIIREALQESAGSLEQGAFRVELISTSGGVAKMRVTGRVLDGLQTQTFSLGKGAQKLSDNWPAGLLVDVVDLDATSATLSLTLQPTD